MFIQNTLGHWLWVVWIQVLTNFTNKVHFTIAPCRSHHDNPSHLLHAGVYSWNCDSPHASIIQTGRYRKFINNFKQCHSVLHPSLIITVQCVPQWLQNIYHICLVNDVDCKWHIVTPYCQFHGTNTAVIKCSQIIKYMMKSIIPVELPIVVWYRVGRFIVVESYLLFLHTHIHTHIYIYIHIYTYTIALHTCIRTYVYII